MGSPGIDRASSVIQQSRDEIYTGVIMWSQAITGTNNEMKAEVLGTFTFDNAMAMMNVNSFELV